MKKLLVWALCLLVSERVMAVAQRALQAVVGVENEGPLAEPRAKVRVNGVSALGTEYQVRYHIIPRQVSPARARHTITKSLLDHLTQEGISPAYPKHNVLYGDGAAGLAEQGEED
jgi:hypothetical protein